MISTATVANILLRSGLRNAYLHGVRPVTPGVPFAGPAYTLRFIPAREDLDSLADYGDSTNLHRRAIEECPPDHVLVIGACGDTGAASAGDLMVRRLLARGAAGVVTDGGFRDTGTIRELGFPAYQHKTAPRATPLALHPVELNGPVGCAGVAVYPGDLIIGDDDGVVVVPCHLADDVVAEATAAIDYETFAEHEIVRGRSLLGLFPATRHSQDEYDGWVAAGRPERTT